MGSNKIFERIKFYHVARRVYEVALPELKEDIEYYIKAVTAEEKELYYPVTAPKVSQTVVVMEDISLGQAK